MTQHPTFSLVTVQPIALDAIIKRLRRLKDHSGQIKADRLWLEDNEPRTLTMDQVMSVNDYSPALVRTTLKSIQRMKETLETLCSISLSLKEVISTVQSQTRPALLHYGINSLPTEILSRIFVLACDPKTSNNRTLSNVCRRFRDVVVNTCSLWTYITTEGSPEWWDLQLRRSGNRSLIVDFGSHVQRRKLGRYSISCNCLDYLALVTKQSHRWSEFIFAVSHPDEYLEQIQAVLADLHLPRLTHLFIDEDCTEAGESKVFRSWRTPLLQRLHCHQDMWPLLATLNSCIVSLNITVEGTASGSLHFLRHPRLSAMEVLSVKLVEMDVDVYEGAVTTDDDLITDDHIALPMLRGLTIDFGCYWPEYTVERFFEHVHLPELKTISTKFIQYGLNADEFDQKTDVDELMLEFQPLCEWFGKPISEFKKQFASLGLINIHLEGYKTVDEGLLEEELKNRIYDGWGVVEAGCLHSPIYQHTPKIEFTFKRPPLVNCKSNDCARNG